MDRMGEALVAVYRDKYICCEEQFSNQRFYADPYAKYHKAQKDHSGFKRVGDGI